MADIWARALAFEAALKASGAFDAQRRDQAKAWLWHELSDSLIEALKADPHVAQRLGSLEAKVSAGKMAPGTAARELLGSFLGR